MPLPTSSGWLWFRIAADSVSPALAPIRRTTQPLSAAAATTIARPRSKAKRAADTRAASDLLFDARGFAAEVSEVVQLGSANITTSFHLDLRDRRAVGLEHAFHAFTVRDLADRKRGIQAAILLRDDHTLVGLQTLPIAFRHADLDHYRIARGKVGDVLFELLLFDFVNDPGHG